MLNSGVVGLAFRNISKFSSVKKVKMELTIRTPYRTILDKFDGFSRVLAKTNEAALVIQNRTPAAAYILPPGHLKVKLTQEAKNVSGDYFHLGGYVFVHTDNTCEINLLDCFDRKDVRADQLDKCDIKDVDTVAGRYATKLRKLSAKAFIKKATI